MDKSREAFAEAAVELGMHDLTRMGSTYLRDPVHICWLTWQACHNYALEEAARIVEMQSPEMSCQLAAAKLRAMKTQEEK